MPRHTCRHNTECILNKSLKRKRKESYTRVLDRVPKCVWRVGGSGGEEQKKNNNKVKTKGKTQALGSGGLQGLVTQASKFVTSTALSLPQMACRKQVH